MANEEHLEWLRESVEAWNARRAKSEFIPDLSGAKLSGSEFTNANFNHADLSRANLFRTNLTNSQLEGAFLCIANLSGTVFSKANLGGTIVTTLFSTVGFKDESTAKYTDISKTKGLTQKQLNAMIGDSGTIIPDHLTRPNHWVVLPWHRGNAGRDNPETDDTFMDTTHRKAARILPTTSPESDPRAD